MLVHGKTLGSDRADALSWRIRRNEFGVAALEIEQLAKERIVFSITDARIIENVVLVVRVLDRIAEFLNPLGVRESFSCASWDRLPPGPDNRRDR